LRFYGFPKTVLLETKNKFIERKNKSYLNILEEKVKENPCIGKPSFAKLFFRKPFFSKGLEKPVRLCS